MHVLGVNSWTSEQIQTICALIHKGWPMGILMSALIMTDEEQKLQTLQA